MPMGIAFQMQGWDKLSWWGPQSAWQWLDVKPRTQLPVLPWQQRGIALPACLETSIEHRGTEQTPSLVAEIDWLLNQLQELGVCLGRQDEIREYLLQFPDLIEMIPLAVNAALDHLPEAQLCLEVYRDPEIEDQYLRLVVRTQNYDESVIERIEAAEKEYLALLVGKEGWLQLTTDFREPESV